MLIFSGEPGSEFARAFSEDQKIGQRIATKTIRAVDPGGAFAGSKQSGET